MFKFNELSVSLTFESLWLPHASPKTLLFSHIVICVLYDSDNNSDCLTVYQPAVLVMATGLILCEVGTECLFVLCKLILFSLVVNLSFIC